MTVTNEMIEAAEREFEKEFNGCYSGRELVEKVLTAALSAAPKAVVKPLEWENPRAGPDEYRWWAKNHEGAILYTIEKTGSQIKPWVAIRKGDIQPSLWAETLDAAQAAAQANYEARILSALTTPPAQAVGVAVAGRRAPGCAYIGCSVDRAGSGQGHRGCLRGPANRRNAKRAPRC